MYGVSRHAHEGAGAIWVDVAQTYGVHPRCAVSKQGSAGADGCREVVAQYGHAPDALCYDAEDFGAGLARGRGLIGRLPHGDIVGTVTGGHVLAQRGFVRGGRRVTEGIGEQEVRKDLRAHGRPGGYAGEELL